MSASSGIATLDDNDCKVVRLSTADYAPQERSRASSGIYGQTMLRLDVEPISDEPLYVEATLLRMPGLAMVVGRRSGTVYRRRREFIDHDGVSITWHSSSSCHAQQLRRTLDVRGGQAIVLTGGEPGLLRIPTLDDYFHLSVPRSCLSTLITDLDDAYCRPIPAENPALLRCRRWITNDCGDNTSGTSEVPQLPFRMCEPETWERNHPLTPGKMDIRPLSAGEGSPFHTRYVQLCEIRFGSACWLTLLVA
jgi:hypothetical protein